MELRPKIVAAVVETHDDLRPLYRVILALGLVAVLILAFGFALLLKFAPPGQRSGLEEAVGLLSGIRGIEAVRFTSADVVRRDLVARIVDAYDHAV